MGKNNKAYTLDHGKKIFIYYIRKDDMSEPEIHFVCDIHNENEKNRAKKNLLATARRKWNPEEKKLTVSFGKNFSLNFDANGNLLNPDFNKLTISQVTELCQKEFMRDSDIHWKSEKVTDFTPKTELHTHLETAMSAKDLITISVLDYRLERGKISFNLFKRLGFEADGIEKTFIDSNNTIDLNKVKEQFPDLYKEIEERFKPTIYDLKTLNTIFGKTNNGFDKDTRFEHDVITVEGPRGKVKGIPVSKLFKKFTNEERRIFSKALSFDDLHQNTFNVLSEIIKNRKSLNFCDTPERFKNFYYILADSLKNKGIEYTEISTASLLNDDAYNILGARMRDILPEVEAKTGVKMRFLACFDRSESKESFDKKFKNLKEFINQENDFGQSYIAGIDIAGYEKEKFQEYMLENILHYLYDNESDLILRLHAGENRAPHENIYNALALLKQIDKECARNRQWEYYLKGKDNVQRIKTAKKELRYYKERGGKVEELRKSYYYSSYIPKIRIGHGIFINDNDPKKTEETLALMKELAVVVELNLSSNFLLNNINGPKDHVLIKQYLEMGIPCVISTDGMGIYNTSPEHEVSNLIEAGVTNYEFEKIRKTEELIIQDKIRDFNYLTRKNREFELKTSEIDETALLNKLNSIKGVPIIGGYAVDAKKRPKITNEDCIKELQSKYKDKIPLIICGPSSTKWDSMNRFDKRKIKKTMKLLVDLINPEKVYFVTGGVNSGAEKYLYEINQKSDNPKEIVGVFTTEAVTELDNINENTFSCAVLAKRGIDQSKYWQDGYSQFMTKLIQLTNGVMVLTGGGDVTNNMIEYVINNGEEDKLNLLENVKGASAEKVKFYSGRRFKFANARVLIEKLFKKLGVEGFIKGFDIDKMFEYSRAVNKDLLHEEKGKNTINWLMEVIKSTTTTRSSMNKAKRELAYSKKVYEEKRKPKIENFQQNKE